MRGGRPTTSPPGSPRFNPICSIEIVEIVSRGDQVLDVPLSQVEGTGFFTSTLERALTAGEIDVAVHSYKDLPVARTPGLMVAAVPKRGPVEEALCARRGRTLATLPRGATVGTCSTRRTAQVKRLRPDLTIVPLRGNVPTRVDRALKGDLDAVVLAYAGLCRLGLTRHVTEVFSTRQMLPAPAQGALAVQCRVADRGLRLLLGRLDHRRTRDAAAAERRVLSVLGGGCSAPVAALCTSTPSGFVLRTRLLEMDTGAMLSSRIEGEDPQAMGLQAARELRAQGAGPWLAAWKAATRVLGAPVRPA